jgi:putative transposase
MNEWTGACPGSSDSLEMRVSSPKSWQGNWLSTRRKHHTVEQIVKKLRDGEAMLQAGQAVAEMVQVLSVSEQPYCRWKSKFGGMKSEQAKRLNELELKNARLKKLLAQAEQDEGIAQNSA